MLSERVTRSDLKVIQKVYVLIPVRALVYLLQGNDIGLSFVDDARDPIEVFSDRPLRMKALVERETAPVSDVEGHEASIRH